MVRYNSFRGKTLLHLLAVGEDRNKYIREEIGLNEHCKNSLYSDRSSYHFGFTAAYLVKEGLIERTRRGYYQLTLEGFATALKLRDIRDEKVKRL